jgi:ankyrin repeat protein
MILATRSNHSEVIAVLLAGGAKRIDAKTEVQIRMIGAAFRGDLRELKQQLECGANVNDKAPSCTYALIEALSSCNRNRGGRNHILVVKELLAKGANPNQELVNEIAGKEIKSSPLHLFLRHPAVYQGKDEVVELLLDAGAKVSSNFHEKKQTPLHIAAITDNTSAARILLQRGSKVMPKDEDGKTPLDYAESASMIDLLKFFGAKEQ